MGDSKLLEEAVVKTFIHKRTLHFYRCLFIAANTTNRSDNQIMYVYIPETEISTIRLLFVIIATKLINRLLRSIPIYVREQNEFSEKFSPLL